MELIDGTMIIMKMEINSRRGRGRRLWKENYCE